MSQPVAIITGAGRGIGRAIAIALAGKGYRLVLISRNEAQLNETAKLSDPDAMIAVVDVTDAQKLRGVVDQTLATFGRIDAVVNNAGNAPIHSVEEMTADEWRNVIDTNLSATFYLSQAVWPVFRKQNAGVIVNISSAASRDPFGGFHAYGAAKAGVNLLTLSMAREGQPLGIRVHAVAPAAVETPLFRTLLTPEQFPSERALDPADVARVVAGCVTGELAYTSGEVIWLHKTV
jgi:3-oxoacyl-[acyl-carrier protein] reductase